jgi:hypothetical protein
MRFLTNVSYVWMLFSNLALPNTATDFELYANGSGGGICASGTAVTQEECFDAAHEVGVGMNLKDFLNVGTWDTTPCGCFIYIDHWVDYKDPASANCLEDVNSNLVCRKEAPPPSDFELYADRSGGICPSLKTVRQEECFDAAHEVGVGMNLKDFLNIGTWGSTPCGCFISIDPWEDYNWVNYKDPASGNCLADHNSKLLCRKDYESIFWQQLADNDIDSETANEYSGRPVALSQDGTTVATGSPWNYGHDSNSGGLPQENDCNCGSDTRGRVRVYKWTGSAWQQLGSDIDGECAYDYFGHSIALSQDGTAVAIGARHGDNDSSSVHVRVYKWTGSAWRTLGGDCHFGDGVLAAFASFAYSVALSQDGTTVAIGAYGGNGVNSGHVRVYKWTAGGFWRQLGDGMDGEGANDYYGNSVALSEDGTTVAIGLPDDDGNGSNSGHVRVYIWTGSAWQQLGDDIDGEAADDLSGYKVALSQDGTTVAIGSPWNDGNGDNSGHVRVYKWTGSAWQQLGNDIDGEAADDYSGKLVALSQDGTTVAIVGGYVRIYILIK